MSINGDVSGSEDKSSESFNFSSADIAKREKVEYFTNVKGADKFKRQAERKEKRADRKRQRAFKKDATKTESTRKKNERAEEAKRLKETKRTRREYRLDKIRKSIWRKRKVIATTVGAVVLVVVAIIVTPIIINAIDQANKDRIIAEGETSLVKIFKTIAGNTYKKSELEEIINPYSNDVAILYMDNAGRIEEKDGYAFIAFSSKEAQDDIAGGKEYDFTYYDLVNFNRVVITSNKYENKYYYDGSEEEFQNIDELITKYILDKDKYGKKE